MKMVIDIPNRLKEIADEYSKIDNKNLDELTYYKMNGRLALFCISKGTPLPKCNECKYYEGVHKVQGHAPCSYHTIGGVMWDWYCSQFEADKENDKK